MGRGQRVTCRLVSKCLRLLSLLTSPDDESSDISSSTSSFFYFFLKTGACCVILATFRLATVLLSQLLSAEITCVCHHAQSSIRFLCKKYTLLY